MFLVRITNVTLADGSLGQDPPRALPDADTVQIEIKENDNARGLFNFGVELVKLTLSISSNWRCYCSFFYL